MLTSAIWDRDARNNYYLQFNDDAGSLSSNDNTATRKANAAKLGFSKTKAIIPSYIQPYLDGKSGLTGTDWQDELFRNAKIENYQISTRGGNENTSYFVSGNFFKQEGIVLGTNFERYRFRVNLKTKLSKQLKLGLNLAPIFAKENAIATGFNDSPVNSVIMGLPYFPAYNSDGTLAISKQVVSATEGGQARSENPVAMALLNKNINKTKKLLGGTYLELDIIEGLKAKTYLGIDLSNGRRNTFNPSIVGVRKRKAPLNPKGNAIR